MNVKIRKEEYTALADFVRVSFVRDQAAIVARYPKLDASFLAAFDAKLNAVKILESGLQLTEQQKGVTASLYAEADVLNKELNFLVSYMKNAGLNSSAVSDLKSVLKSGNIEGSILKMESVKQFVVANKAALVDEGMNANFDVTLENHKNSLESKNTAQNDYINSRKTLTSENRAEYSSLYAMIVKIAKSGKLIFNGSVTQDEYTITKKMIVY